MRCTVLSLTFFQLNNKVATKQRLLACANANTYPLLNIGFSKLCKFTNHEEPIRNISFSVVITHKMNMNYV